MKNFVRPIIGVFVAGAALYTSSQSDAGAQSSSGVKNYSSTGQEVQSTTTTTAVPARQGQPAYYRRTGGMTTGAPPGYYRQQGGMTLRPQAGGMTLRPPTGGMTVNPQAGYQYQRVPQGSRQAVSAAPTGTVNYAVASQAKPAQTGSHSETAGNDKSENVRQSIVSNGVQRTFLLHLPAGFSKSKSYPIIFVCHGLHMDGHLMYLMSNMSYWADKKGFIAVYPDGLGHQWERSGNDALFINDLIKHISSIAHVDQHRIYAAGISNGGHFVQSLACQSDRIAAIAVVAATFVGSDCASTRPVPVILFLGTDDPLVPSTAAGHKEELGKLGESLGISGLGSFSPGIAKMGGFSTSEETVEFWCHHNGTASQGYTTQLPDSDAKDGTRVTRTVYGSGSTEVDYYKIQGGGHSWPGSMLATLGGTDVLGRTSQDVDASRLIAEFFLKH